MTKISEIKLDSLKGAEYICIFIVKEGDVITSDFDICSFEELLDILVDNKNNITDQVIDDLYVKVNDYFIGYESITPDSEDGRYVMYTVRIK